MGPHHHHHDGVIARVRSILRPHSHDAADSVDPTLEGSSAGILRSVPAVRDVDDLRLRWIGHRIRAETDLAVDGRLTLAEHT